MKRLSGFVKMLWQQDKWLFGMFTIGMLSILAEVAATLVLVYTAFSAKDTLYFSKSYIVSQSWAWSGLIVLEVALMTGIFALLLMVLYVIFMKLRKIPVNWRQTILLGTMSFWSFILWFIFTLILGFLLRLLFSLPV